MGCLVYCDWCLWPGLRHTVYQSIHRYSGVIQDPASLLRVNRKHFVKITLLNGSDGAVNLPVSQISYFKIWPAGATNDFQEMEVFTLKQQGHLLEGVGLWHTTSHTFMSLGVLGEGSWESSIGVRLEATNQIAQVSLVF